MGTGNNITTHGSQASRQVSPPPDVSGDRSYADRPVRQSQAILSSARSSVWATIMNWMMLLRKGTNGRHKFVDRTGPRLPDSFTERFTITISHSASTQDPTASCRPYSSRFIPMHSAGISQRSRASPKNQCYPCIFVPTIRSLVVAVLVVLEVHCCQLA